MIKRSKRTAALDRWKEIGYHDARRATDNDGVTKEIYSLAHIDTIEEREAYRKGWNEWVQWVKNNRKNPGVFRDRWVKVKAIKFNKNGSVSLRK